MKKYLYISFAFLICSLISCEKMNDAEIVKECQLNNYPITLADSLEYYYDYADSVGRTLTFMHIEDRIKKSNSKRITRTAELSSIIDDEIINENIFWFIRIQIELGRKSRSCRGFGICHIGLLKENVNLLDSDLALDNSSYIEMDDFGRSYADYLLAEPLDNNIDSDALLLPVDEDIQEDVIIEPDEANTNLLNLPQAYKLSRGVYHFNENLGLYGGYRIYLDPIY